jgi:hypothetical protein
VLTPLTKRIIPWIVLISLVFIIFSCKKEDHNHYVSQEFKEWTIFKPGSYWVYKNETTNVTDSIYVISNPATVLFKDQDNPHDFYEITSTDFGGNGF